MTKLILISFVLVVFLAVAGKKIETKVKEPIEYSINLFHIFQKSSFVWKEDR